MATLDKNEIQFTGSIGKITAYRVRGLDKIVVRAKGGPTKQQVRTSPRFTLTRLNNSEFSGAVQAAKSIRFTMMLPILKLADHNFTPRLNSICSSMQKEEKINPRGKRGVHLSEHRELLKGFSLTRKNPFVNIVSNPLDTVLDREAKTAVVRLPRLIKGINLVLPWRHPLYRFTFSLGVAEDVMHDGSGYYNPERLNIAATDTEWHMNGTSFLPQTIELKLDMPEALKDTQTMILSVGIEMGQPDANGEIDSVQYAGSACILALG